MTGKQLPRWTLSLRQIRYDAGNPTLRSLSEELGFARASLGNWFNGMRPTRERIEALLDALTDDQKLKDTVLTEFDDEGSTTATYRRHPHYRWLQLLNISIAEEAWDGLHVLASAAAMPVILVENIFDGSYIPPRAILERLVFTMTQIDAMREIIMNEYDEEVDQNLLEELNDPPGGVSADARLLADAINNLAEAIRQATNRKV